MKNYTTCVLVSISLLALSLTSLNGNQKSSSSKSEVSPPVPVKTVTPVINTSTLRDGLTVEMIFTVNEAGRAVKIDPKIGFQGLRSQERDFAAALKTALTSWRFEPARNEHGQAMARKVIIPFTYSKENGSSIRTRAIAKKEIPPSSLASSEN